MTGPLIIAGDFNATEGSDVVNILDEKFIRTCQQCKTALPDSKEKVIDFIAFRTRENFAVVSHQSIPEQYASDHFPIVSVLRPIF